MFFLNDKFHFTDVFYFFCLKFYYKIVLCDKKRLSTSRTQLYSVIIKEFFGYFILFFVFLIKGFIAASDFSREWKYLPLISKNLLVTFCIKCIKIFIIITYRKLLSSHGSKTYMFILIFFVWTCPPHFWHPDFVEFF